MAPVKRRFRLVSPDRLRTLMERTGSGASITGRALAAAVGVPHGTVDHLLAGYVKTQPEDVAYAIAGTIGVDVLVLWTPTGRSVPLDDDPAQRMTATP